MVHGGAAAAQQGGGLAVDVIALMDALAIDRAVVAGFDWGARTAAIVAALWPERCRGLVSVSGYLIGSRAANQAPLPPEAELASTLRPPSSQQGAGGDFQPQIVFVERAGDAAAGELPLV